MNNTRYGKHFWWFSTFRTKNIHVFSVSASGLAPLFCFCQRTRTVRALSKAFLVLSSFRTKDIHISCLFLLTHSSYDRYSLTSKNYEPHAVYRKHFWWFSTFRTKNIHMSFLFLPAPSHLFSVSASALAPLALYRKHF